MSSGKNILGIGYIFSFLTLLALFSIIGVFIALITYPLSIILRSIGWVSLGRNLEEGKYKLTGISDIILGFLFFVSILGGEAISNVIGIGSEYILFMGLIFWATYSIIEWVSYLTFFKKGLKLFIGSMISIIGIILTLAFYGSALMGGNGGLGELFILLYILRVSTVFLMVSSLITAIAFFKLDLVPSAE